MRNVVLLLVAGTMAFLSWVLLTPTGAAWILQTSIQRIPVKVSFSRISGSLVSDLRLDGLQVAWDKGEVQAEELTLDWNPLALLGGHFHLSKLKVDKAVVRLSAVSADSQAQGTLQHPISEPSVPKWLSFFRGTISDLRLDDVHVETPDAPPLFSGSLTGRLTWHDGILSLEKIDLQSNWGDLLGHLEFGVIPKFVECALDWRFPPVWNGYDRLTLSLVSEPRKGAMLASRIQVELFSKGIVREDLVGDLTVYGDRLTLGSFALSHEMRGGSIQGDALWRFYPGEPHLEVDARLADLDLSTLFDQKTSISGQVSAEGALGSYAGGFSLENKGSDWKQVQLSGLIEGGIDFIKLSMIQGQWLHGAASGDLAVRWDEGVGLSATLEGRQLDPSVFRAGWPEGQINLHAGADLMFSVGHLASWNVNLGIQDSQVQGHFIKGAVLLRSSNRDILVEKLQLEGEQIALRAWGRYPDRIDVHAKTGNFSGIVPVEIDHGRLDGWIGWHDGLPVGKIEASCSRLASHGAEIQEVVLHAERLGLDANSPVAVRIQGGSLDYRVLHAQELHFSVGGTLSHHSGTLNIRWPSGFAALVLNGRYELNQWQGTIKKLDWNQDGVGAWHLGEEAKVFLSTTEIDLSDLSLVSSQGERVMIQGSSHTGLEHISGKLQWESLDLGYANAWLKDMSLTGKSDGILEISQQGDQLERAFFQIQASSRITRNGKNISIHKGSAEALWDHSGLKARSDLHLSEGGNLSVVLGSEVPVAMALPSTCTFSVDWQALPLQLFSLWVSKGDITGNASGHLEGGWKNGEGLPLTANTQFSATFAQDPLTLRVQSGRAEMVWDEQGLRSTSEIHLAESGVIAATLHSDRSSKNWPRGLPDDLAVKTSWQGLDLEMARPWVPPSLEIQGAVSGFFQGRLLENAQFECTANAAVDDGHLEWQGEEGKISVPVRKASVGLTWSQKGLTGELSLSLENYGTGLGHFSYPLAAGFPLKARQDMPVQAAFHVEAREKGLLTSFFPGLVRESTGKVNVDLNVTGTLSQPILAGEFLLNEGGAYFPAAGVLLEDVNVAGHFLQDRMDIVSLQCRSGGGTLNGNGSLFFRGWHLDHYRFELTGDRFQAINLPDLQVKISPTLTAEGSAQHVLVTGEVKIPEMLILGKQAPSTQRASHDVVLLSETEKETNGSGWKGEARVRLVLGERVLVKVGGLDGRLEGSLMVHALGADNVTAQGTITVAEGAYAAYGIRLDISRGSIVFAGGPVEQPSLDILAIRKVGEIEAGVQISGTASVPVVKLYSEPTMPDTDVLSYIVLGHPLGGESQNSGALMLAAGALLSKGESTVLQDKIQRRLGLDVLDIESGDGDVSKSVITVGKYLGPDLYVSLGHSLYSQTNEVRLRYTVSKRWELETEMGEVSGADLFYKIEFQ